MKEFQENLKVKYRYNLVCSLPSKNKTKMNEVSYKTFHESPIWLDFVNFSQHILWGIVRENGFHFITRRTPSAIYDFDIFQCL